MSKYPSPCDTCAVADTGCSGKNCQPWRIRYLYRQKQINAFARKLATGTTVHSKFVYAHPDELRRMLEKNPCEGCLIEKICEEPCEFYIWRFVEKIRIARKRAEK